MGHPNEELARRAYAAFGTGDLATLKELIDDEATWHVAGNSPIAGDYEGQGAVFGLFGRLAELSGGSFRLEVHDILANDEHVVALVNAHGSREGKADVVGQPIIHVMHVTDGRVTDLWSSAFDQTANDAFWS